MPYSNQIMINGGKEKSGLYIHIPFCLSKCGYCSFYSVVSPHLLPEFVKTIVRETEFYKNAYPAFDTIYFGGGTPSLLSVEQISEILNSIYRSFTIDNRTEITIEGNPGDISYEYLKVLRTLGINRLNIGIQSFDDHILNFLGRRHTAKEAIASLNAARKAGFENIGIDLIYGVIGQDIQAWRNTLRQALSFSPEHLSCYQLSLESQTSLYQHYQQENFSLPSENEALDLFMTTSQLLTEAGYIHYEVSNFARLNSLKSRHNLKYWRHIPYLGLGPAAHSFNDQTRWWNKSDVNAYIKSIFDNQKPVDHFEYLSSDQLALEALFLGLRTREGIDLKHYKAQYGEDLLSSKKQSVEELIKNNLVEIKDGCLCPTLEGMAVADSLALI